MKEKFKREKRRLLPCKQEYLIRIKIILESIIIWSIILLKEGGGN
jgi:hypothetical protein